MAIAGGLRGEAVDLAPCSTIDMPYIADAEIVFGGKRHLELAASLIRGAVRPWPSPFERAAGEVTEEQKAAIEDTLESPEVEPYVQTVFFETKEEAFDSFQEQMAEVLEGQINAEIEAGNLPEGTIEQVDELTDKWTQRVADLGFEDGGDMGELPEWYSADDDWSAWAKDLWENSGALDHRPGA